MYVRSWKGARAVSDHCCSHAAMMAGRRFSHVMPVLPKRSTMCRSSFPGSVFLVPSSLAHEDALSTR